MRKITHQKFVKIVQDKFKDEFIIIGTYQGSHIPIEIKHNCNECDHYTWNVRPNNLLHGSGCPKCAIIKKRITHEEFAERIKKKYNNELILSTSSTSKKYTKSNEKVTVMHNSKNCKYYKAKKEYYEWQVIANDLLTKKKRCPVCFNDDVVLGINSIYDTDRWMISLGVCEEDAKKYTSGSGEQITVICPDCNIPKHITISHIKNRGTIQCDCNRTISYPEKFLRSVLHQLDIDYITEYSPKWSNDKRYDFFVKDKELIIETHGKQHFQKSNGFMRELEEEKENDKIKKNIALNNGIKHYIQLDCSESNMDYIKDSINNSEIQNLFDLSGVDWKKCDEFATSNIVKNVCEYWNNNQGKVTTKDLTKEFKLCKKTIITYLKKGNEFGWCKYNAKIESQKASSKNGKSNGKKVQVFDKNGKDYGIFDSCTALEKQSEKHFKVKFERHCIADVCKGKLNEHRGYIFKYVNDNK